MNSQILVKINSFIKNRLFELSGILLIIISVFLLVSIITYSGGQGNFIYKAENSEIDYANFGGFYGSAIADFLLQSIGLIVFLVILNLCFWGFKLINKKRKPPIIISVIPDSSSNLFLTKLLIFIKI